ncbi:MAG: methyltransferase domain-containing protein [Ignavibacteriaceae bacterium]
MEVKVNSQKSHPEKFRDDKVKNNAWLNPAHPNFEKWKRARDLAVERGKFVKSITEKHVTCRDLTILDLGSGEGGTSVVFSEQNQVFGYDLNLIRLERQKEYSANYYKINGNALKLSFRNDSFDLIIIQDVIEHLYDTNQLINEIIRVLKPNGLIYMSTPNKYSVFNFVADPHWGLPFVSILKRKIITKYFLKYFRKSEINRKDIPELLSLNNIYKYLSKYFEINLETTHSVERLLNGDKGLVWSNFHFTIINFIRSIKAEKILLILANNKKGIINKYFNPTFYLTARKIK